MSASLTNIAFSNMASSMVVFTVVILMIAIPLALLFSKHITSKATDKTSSQNKHLRRILIYVILGAFALIYFLSFIESARN